MTFTSWSKVEIFSRAMLLVSQTKHNLGYLQMQNKQKSFKKSFQTGACEL